MTDLTSKREQSLSYLILVIPAVAIYFAVVAFPTAFSVALSLTNYNGGKVFGNPKVHFAGVKSYIEIFTNPNGYFYIALKNNMYIVLMSVFGQIPLGFILAYILSRKMIKGTDFFQTMVYLPNVISPVIIGILFKSFYLNSNSVYMEIVRIFNPAAEFTLNNHPMIPVLIVMLWMYTGMYVIIFLANIQRIDVSIIEAARIDGAKETQIFSRIILPALSGVIVTSAILAISGSLKSFDLIYVMTNGGPANQTSVLSLFMYMMAFRGAPNYPLANAISTVMVIISFILIGVTKSVEKKFGGKE
ncbi:carbohydrate ABC transporter permease [Leadbettera azotonutricia]|uniref:Sugar ABC transporter permease n=1 Tax=Leadbettera azotonutricia (strain ATCC BAA-888 / DSM 13862 / ZAS-9) TaxID=545695 RepID=F5Y8B0_LEAAZ|nr:sugar ABC transporter permease [Leadbettera azotonutricia]AEF81005.1 sugar ABC transporter permease [Leadbettera azotonutricia ZAS-9]